MPRIIEVTVSPRGEAIVQTKGYTGAGCRDASRFVEQALGVRAAETLTADFHQTHDTIEELRQSFKVPVFAVVADNREIGLVEGRQMAALLPKGGTVLYIQGPWGSAAARLRRRPGAAADADGAAGGDSMAAVGGSAAGAGSWQGSGATATLCRNAGT